VLNFIASSALIICGAYFSYRRGLRYLHALQQDEYTIDRFWEWFKSHRAFDKKGSALALLTPFLMNFLNPFFANILSLVACAGLLTISQNEPNPLRRGKIRLVMTPRATLLFSVAATAYIALLVVILCFRLGINDQNSIAPLWILHVILFQAVPFLFCLSVIIQKPSEERRQSYFLGEAKQKLNLVNPYIIGITGSYGKTSTKNLLGEVMQITLAPTFWPPRGINTLMGNTRAIREDLKTSHKYAIIEMAAYREGSIQRQCELTPPTAAIITAIGHMHLERFGSSEAIYKAKTELARAVPADGILVCNGDNPGARKAAKEFKKKTTLLYGFEGNDLDCKISELKFSPSGSSFTLNWAGKSYTGSTGLLGKPALSNLLAAFTMACSLGSDPEFVLGALGNVKPVDNRLSIKNSGKVVFLNDAYNSNPIGFSAALDVLSQFPGKRKILITPGMIELGSRQAEENAVLARQAAKVCNLVFIVGNTNRRALTIGLEEQNFSMQNVHYFEHRDPALQELLRIQQDGDVVLIENDLPDWYEERHGF